MHPDSPGPRPGDPFPTDPRPATYVVSDIEAAGLSATQVKSLSKQSGQVPAVTQDQNSTRMGSPDSYPYPRVAIATPVPYADHVVENMRNSTMYKPMC